MREQSCEWLPQTLRSTSVGERNGALECWELTFIAILEIWLSRLFLLMISTEPHSRSAHPARHSQSMASPTKLTSLQRMSSSSERRWRRSSPPAVVRAPLQRRQRAHPRRLTQLASPRSANGPAPTATRCQTAAASPARSSTRTTPSTNSICAGGVTPRRVTEPKTAGFVMPLGVTTKVARATACAGVSRFAMEAQSGPPSW